MSHDRLQPAHALVMTGIQDTNEDWVALQKELHGSINLHFSCPNIDLQDIREEDRSEYWIQETINQERGDARTLSARIILGHSYGAHRVFPILQDVDTIEGAILLAPAANEIQDHIETPPSGVRDGSLMENMMRQITLDMSDEEFKAFCHRHDKAYKKRKKEIRAQFGFLRDGPEFGQMLKMYKGDKPILILHSEEDPWNPKKLPRPKNVSYRKLPEGTGHYPHVSKAKEVAAAILRFCSEYRIDLHEALTSTA